jgi:hypothetical protein
VTVNGGGGGGAARRIGAGARRWRSVGAAAVVAVGVAVGGTALLAPANAAADLCQPGIEGTSPAGDLSSPTPDARSAAPTVNVQGEFHYDRNVIGQPSGDTHVNVVIVACRNQVLPEHVDYTRTDAANSVPFTWTTPPLPWNGPYAVHVEVDSPAGSKTVTRLFAVVVPPATPSDVRAVQAGDGLNVTWARNPEPDIVGYRVQRAEPSGGFKPIGDVAATAGAARPSLFDHPPLGDWRYNVVTLRQGATDTEGIASDPSPAATATMAAPTPTTAAGSSSAGTTPGSGTTNTSSPAANAAIAKAGRVDLSSFSALLDQRAKAIAKASEEPDPGFGQTLPFKPGDEPALAANADKEAGAGQAQGAGQRLVSDDSDRRRAVASLAGALLLFVMFMQVRWVRTELDEEDLEATEPGGEHDEHHGLDQHGEHHEHDETGEHGEHDEHDEHHEHGEHHGGRDETGDDGRDLPPMLTPLDVTTVTAAAADSPHLDVPYRTRRRREVGQGRPTSTARSTHATGRATRRLPPRPADDRGQGAAPVRARGRGSRGGDGRLPVG